MRGLFFFQQKMEDAAVSSGTVNESGRIITENGDFSIPAFLNMLANWATTAGVRILAALVLAFISFKLLNFIGRRIVKRLESKMDKTLCRTFVSVGRVSLKCVIAVALVGYVGIDTSGLAALITALGICIGLAANGALANLAGGALILISRPFKLDDRIAAEGYVGVVEDIHLAHTKLRTDDNRTVYLPNGPLSRGCVVNESEKETLRLTLDFLVAEGTDCDVARQLLLDAAAEETKTLKDPAPSVRIDRMNENGIRLSLSAWTKSEDNGEVCAALGEKIPALLAEHGIEKAHAKMEVLVRQ